MCKLSQMGSYFGFAAASILISYLTVTALCGLAFINPMNAKTDSTITLAMHGLRLLGHVTWQNGDDSCDHRLCTHLCPLCHSLMSFHTHIARELSAFHREITERLPSNLILKTIERIFRFVG